VCTEARAARANQPRVGSGRYCMAVGASWNGGWPLGPTGAIDVNSSRLPCNQLARLDPALAWLLCGRRVYFCLPSWAGVCRWCGGRGVVRWGDERKRDERERKSGERARAWEWSVVCRQDAFASSRKVATQARSERGEGSVSEKNRSVAPPDPRGCFEKTGNRRREGKKGGHLGGWRWYSDSQVALCSNTERERQWSVKLHNSRREEGENGGDGRPENHGRGSLIDRRRRGEEGGKGTQRNLAPTTR
jgi:hypothetical protein